MIYQVTILILKIFMEEKIMFKILLLRDKKLDSLDNVKFIEMNSLNLINHNEIYDLIWIDGSWLPCRIDRYN